MLDAVTQAFILKYEAAQREQRDAANARRQVIQNLPGYRKIEAHVKQLNTDALNNSVLPAITRVDFYGILERANKQANGQDRGLKLAKANAYDLWMKDPSGTLSVGDVTKFAKYWQESDAYSKVASVINSELPKVGFNTLPMAKLTRLAQQIAESNDPQKAFDNLMGIEGLDGVRPEQVRARAYIRQMAQLMDLNEESPEPIEFEAETEAEAVSPNTGAPLKIELEASFEQIGQLEPAEEESVVMVDPTDPTGESEVEVVLRPVAYRVWAFSAAGERGATPLEEFEAPSMSHALNRLSKFQVSGKLFARKGHEHEEILVKLPSGESLQIVASQEVKLKPETPSVPTMTEKQARTLVERELMDGSGEVRVAGQVLRITDSFDLDVNGKRYDLATLDTHVANLVKHVAKFEPKVSVTELFTLRCPKCATLNDFTMPKKAEDMSCECGGVTPANKIAQLFNEGMPSTGFVLVADVPGITAHKTTADRMLKAVKSVVAGAEGAYNGTSLEIVLPADSGPALPRVQKLLYDRFGVGNVERKAQMQDDPEATGWDDGRADVMRGAKSKVDELALTDPDPVKAAWAKGYLDGYFTYGDEEAEKYLNDQLAKSSQMLEPEIEPAFETPGAEPVIAPPTPEMGPEMGGTEDNLTGEETEAIRAALTHFRNQGEGPLSALNHVASSYRGVIERFGDKSDHARHIVEAQIISIAADVFREPALLNTKRSNHDQG